MKKQNQAARFLETKRVTHPVKESKVVRDEDEEKQRSTGVLGKETKASVEEAEAREVAIGKTSPEAALSTLTGTCLYNVVHKGNINSKQLKSLSQKSTCKKHLLLTSEAFLKVAV